MGLGRVEECIKHPLFQRLKCPNGDAELCITGIFQDSSGDLAGFMATVCGESIQFEALSEVFISYADLPGIGFSFIALAGLAWIIWQIIKLGIYFVKHARAE